MTTPSCPIDHDLLIGLAADMAHIKKSLDELKSSWTKEKADCKETFVTKEEFKPVKETVSKLLWGGVVSGVSIVGLSLYYLLLNHLTTKL